MSHIIYLTLEGNQQGLISSGCSTFDSIGNRYQKGHEDQIQVLGLNHTITREENIAHHPIQLIKPIDKSSPLLCLVFLLHQMNHLLLLFSFIGQTWLDN